MKPITLTIAIIIIIASFAKAQELSNAYNNSIINTIQITNKPTQGQITITQSHEIEQLFNNRLYQNTQNPGMQGYRIRIFSETGQNAREKSNQAMFEFSEEFPDVQFYQKYENPYWKVSVGNFRTKESAQKFYRKVLNSFPKSFIVSDWINFPSLETEYKN